ncbi:MAG TPA: multicopper oxidase domain-containing protein [Actinokineospora sp.]|nr:multicopper oxidase domain-containing protein [Actinokineospora sp.]
MKRRNLLKAGAVVGAGLVLPLERLVASAAATANLAAFSVPLLVPPVLKPKTSTPDTDYYEMTIKPADVEIIPGTTSRVMTFNGSFPGPTLAVTQGRPVVVKQINELGEPVNVHLHGAFVAPEHDGYPTHLIQPGASRDYRYPNQQRATTLWYHSHTHHKEAEQVYRGLAGFYVINDPGDPWLNLPTGARDVPLLFRDIRIDENNQLVYFAGDFRGRRTILVNGRPQPYFKVATRKYRLRLLNGSNDRGFKFSLSNGAKFYVIGSDGGYLPNNVPLSTIELFPAERLDVIVDFAGQPVGTQITLRNEFGEAAETQDIMRFDVDRVESDSTRIPDNGQLPQLPAIPTPTVTRDIALNFDLANRRFLINGQPFDPNRVDFTVRKDKPELWRITNNDTQFGITHSMHLHLVQFRVVSRNGVAVAPVEAGWKDTVTVHAGETVLVNTTFTGFTGKYVFHCHLLDHSNNGMMAQVEVIA